ncbi:MAG: FeoA domain-containing protein [Thermochromatium sp.]
MLQFLIHAASDHPELYRPMSQTPDPLRLTDLPNDIPARLVEIRGGRHLTRRLLGLGLRHGSQLRVVQRRGHGLVLACGEMRIALGSGIAEKLWVTPCDQPEPPLETPGSTSPQAAVEAKQGR